MQWQVKRPLKCGQQRVRRKFFWWPTEVQGTAIWLERHWVRETFHSVCDGPAWWSTDEIIDWFMPEALDILKENLTWKTSNKS